MSAASGSCQATLSSNTALISSGRSGVNEVGGHRSAFHSSIAPSMGQIPDFCLGGLDCVGKRGVGMTAVQRRHDLPPGFRSSWSHDHANPGVEQGISTHVEMVSCVHALGCRVGAGYAGSKVVTRGGGWTESAW